jgi:hypothetical protein
MTTTPDNTARDFSGVWSLMVNDDAEYERGRELGALAMSLGYRIVSIGEYDSDPADITYVLIDPDTDESEPTPCVGPPTRGLDGIAEQLAERCL